MVSRLLCGAGYIVNVAMLGLVLDNEAMTSEYSYRDKYVVHICMHVMCIHVHVLIRVDSSDRTLTLSTHSTVHVHHLRVKSHELRSLSVPIELVDMIQSQVPSFGLLYDTLLCWGTANLCVVDFRT